MSNKLVTGDALNDILHSVKEYVDYYDLDFMDATYNETMEMPELSLTVNTIDEIDVDKIIEKHFFIPKE